MHHSQEIKFRVRELRKQGLSLNQIYKKTGIPKTTIRTWISDIQLSDNQLAALQDRVQRALQNGRVKKEKLQRKFRLDKENRLGNEAKSEIGKMSKRDILIAGIALYWAEGFKNKHERRLGFCNSDPEMIIFYIKWLEEVLEVSKKDLIARLTLNSSYKEKTKEIENYWSKVTSIPLNQFGKTFYQKTKWKKQYSSENYHGVLRIHVKNSLDYLLKMKGWIKGFTENHQHDKISSVLPG